MGMICLEPLWVYVLKGIIVWVREAGKLGIAVDHATAAFLAEAFHAVERGFSGDEAAFIRRIREAVTLRDRWRVLALGGCGSGCDCSCGGESGALAEYATWQATTDEAIRRKAAALGPLSLTREEIDQIKMYALENAA